jgi:hypothetical protein
MRYRFDVASVEFAEALSGVEQVHRSTEADTRTADLTAGREIPAYSVRF